MRRIIFCFLCLTATLGSRAQTDELPRSIPELEGVSSKAVHQLFDSLVAVPKTDVHSVMVLRHGRVIGEIYPKPFNKVYKHTLYSCSKTFLSVAVGIAISENRLSLTDRVVALLPVDCLPDTISDNLAAMTVRDLLVMASGIEPDWTMRNHCTNWQKTWLSKPLRERPGKVFRYDSMCSYLLSAIVQKATGTTLLEYLKRHVFDAMNIRDVEWELSPEGINTGGWGLRMQPESMAKFGLLLLQRGKWNDSQLIPENWVDEMMREQINTGNASYGYHMWMCDYPTACVADGALGQSILVVPEKDMVVVITECMAFDGSRQRQQIWKILMPAATESPQKPGKDYKKLQKAQANYALRTAKGEKYTPKTASLIGQTFQLEDNRYGWKSMKITALKNNELRLDITDQTGNCIGIALANKSWAESKIDTQPVYSILAQGRMNGVLGPFSVAGSYGFTGNNRLEIRLHYVDWVSVLDLVIKNKDGQTTIQARENNGDTFSLKILFNQR